MHRAHLRLSAVLVLTICVAAAADDPPTFTPPPRLATTATELNTLRASAGFAATREQAIAVAAPLLTTPPVVPDGAGNWTFYYACPDDGRGLEALNPGEHRCPQCKQIYRDERTVGAYRTLLHDRANAAAETLAWAYAYGGDEACARGVQRILLKLADDYASYPKRHDRWGHNGLLAPLGGRRYSQSLDEAVGIIPLAKAYDLTRGATCWSDAQRRHVESDLFRATADTLLVANLDINNHQTWFNAGLMAIASVLGDRQLVQRVLTMRGGFRDQLARSVDRDGLWYEGTMAYQNYALQAMVQIVDTGRRLGLPLQNEPKFRTLLMGPLRCAYPNGQFPAINDSDPMGIASFDWSFQWAAGTYPDWAGKPAPAVETNSVNLSDAGLAILRRGTGPDAICAMIDYGPHGGDHGHFDKLNLMLFANRREWLLDPGRIDYSHKEYKTWVKHTAAHNTVTLGGRSQAATTGKLVWFEANDRLTGCAMSSDDAYPGAVLTRYLLMTDDVLVDLFTVAANTETQIDLLTHAVSERLLPADGNGAGAPVITGTTDGYPHLTPATAFTFATPTHWDFVAADAMKLRLWTAGGAPEQQISTTGIGYTVEAKIPCLIRRVTGRAATFATAYDLRGKGNFVTSIELDPATPGRVVVGTTSRKLKVTFSATGAVLE